MWTSVSPASVLDSHPGSGVPDYQEGGSSDSKGALGCCNSDACGCDKDLNWQRCTRWSRLQGYCGLSMYDARCRGRGRHSMGAFPGGGWDHHFSSWAKQVEEAL